MLEKKTTEDGITPESPQAEPDWRSSVSGARRMLKAALIVAIVSCLLLMLLGKLSNVALVPLGTFGLLLAFALLMVAGVRSLLALVQMGHADKPIGFMEPLLAVSVVAMSAFGAFVALLGTFGMSRGRQLRKHGRVLLPPLAPNGDWAALEMDADIPEGVRAAVAARWRENGRTEHASVAAFARLTLDLIALGAPPELIHAANRDAHDEIRHAELCFSLAKALDRQIGGPGPFPQAQTARTLPSNRTLALSQLAVDSLIDGALNEGISARVLAQLSRRCEVPAIRSLLRELATDEARHCAHGWEVVEWCLAKGGEPVAQALRAAVAILPEHPRTEQPPEARGGGWEAFGIHGTVLEKTQHSQARAALIERVRTLTRPAARTSPAPVY